MTVQPGVPWRNSVWKHRVVDGPFTSDEFLSTSGGEAGEEVNLKARFGIEQVDTLVGEKGDSFVVNLQLKTEPKVFKSAGNTLHDPKPRIQRTGYRQLWAALWYVHHTVSCTHYPALPNTIVLEPGWSVVEGFVKSSMMKEKRWNVFHAANNSAARWRTLIGILQYPNVNSLQTKCAMLRGPDCCLNCAMDQTSKLDGTRYLVL